MGRYILVVPSRAHPGRDDEYNAWYDDIHIDDLLAIPGVTAGRRFEALANSPSPAPQPYLAIYEIEAQDPLEVMDDLKRRASRGDMDISPALDISSANMWLYKAR